MDFLRTSWFFISRTFTEFHLHAVDISCSALIGCRSTEVASVATHQTSRAAHADITSTKDYSRVNADRFPHRTFQNTTTSAVRGSDQLTVFNCVDSELSTRIQVPPEVSSLHIKRLRSLFSCCCLQVHHVNKSFTKTYSQWSESGTFPLEQTSCVTGAVLIINQSINQSVWVPL